MNTVLLNICIIIFIHFLSDFVFQTKSMIKNKSKNIFWLLTHVTIYTTTLFWAWVFIVKPKIETIQSYFILYHSLFFIHLIVDFIIGKINRNFLMKSKSRSLKRIQKNKYEHKLLVLSAIEQSIYITFLIIIYNYINI